METNKILNSDYLDILFEGRNTAYGGYELRKNYNKRMAKSLVIITILALITTTSAVISVSASNKDTNDMVSREIVLFDPVGPPKPPPPPTLPTPPPSPPPVQPTVKFTPPIIEADDKITDEPPTQEKLKGMVAGLSDNNNATCDPRGLFNNDLDTASGAGIIEPPTPPKVFTYVAEPPTPPYDVYAYLGKHIKYPPAARENNIEGRILVKFVVNEDGAVTNAEIAGSKRFGGGLEEEALRVVSTLPDWNAGKQNGRAVKVYYTLPVMFVLQ